MNLDQTLKNVLSVKLTYKKSIIYRCENEISDNFS